MNVFSFLFTVEMADCFLLVAMAYDHYVAKCSPLQYRNMMSKKLCIQATTGACVAGNMHSMIHRGLLFGLAFRGSNHISHFYCDVLPFYRLSCVDPYVNELVLFVFSGSIQVFTIGGVLISYLYILFTIVKMNPKREGLKPFLLVHPAFCLFHYFTELFFSCTWDQICLKKETKIYQLLFCLQ